MIRSINLTRATGKNSLDVSRKNRCWINRPEQQRSTISVSSDKDKENINQESSCALKKSTFFNSQKRNDTNTAVESILSKVPVPTK